MDRNANTSRVKTIHNVIGEQTLSLEEIAKQTNFSKSTVNECVISLRQDGLIEVHTHTDVDGNSEKVITSVQNIQQKKRLNTSMI